MSSIRRFLVRLGNVFRRAGAERDLDREIAAHLALLEEDLRRGGLAPDQARLAARRRFGSAQRARELQRAARSFATLDDMRRDVLYVSRTLRRAPAFTAAAVLTLAIGIGGSAAVFSVFDAVLLRPLPFPEPDRLVLVFEDNARAGLPRDAVRPRNFAAWAAGNDVLESAAALTEYGAVLHGRGEPLRVTGRRVTRSFFAVLGIRPALGREFTEAEDRPGGPRVVVISHAFWQQRFGGDPGVVGRDLVLDQERYAIVGVMPRGFQFLESYVALWVPAAFSPAELAQGARYLRIVGRMKPAVDAAQVRANLDAIAGRLSSLAPDDDRWRTLRAVVVPLKEQVAGAARRPLTVLLAAVGVVLLITCANLASLLLARAAARRHEIALRIALGASRGRVIRQLLAETIVLAAMGLALGVVLAGWSVAFLAQLVPPAMTLFAQPALDGRALAIAALVSLAAAILFGLAPALQTSAVGAGEALKSNSRSTASYRGRNAFVVAEIAMTLVLVVAAGLLLQTLYRLRYANLGVLPERVLTLRVPLPSTRYPDHARRAAFHDDVLTRIGRLPGVVAAGVTTSVPLEWKGATSQIVIDGDAPDPALVYAANHRQVSAGYLQAIGTPLRRGRYFSAGDTAKAQPVVIVNEALARTFLPGREPIGRRIAIDAAGSPGVSWLTIVGVVGDVRQMGLDLPARPELYLPYAQFGAQPWFAPRDLVVRTAGDPLDLTAAIKHEIHAVDPQLAISSVRTLDEILDEDVAARRPGTALLAVFAGFALVLASVGIYGVIACFVVQHVPEMGVRLALGAQGRDITALVVGRGMRLTLAGAALGTAGALASARLMASLLPGFAGTGFTMCLLAGALLISLAFLASYVPARRATRLDPVMALRSE